MTSTYRVAVGIQMVPVASVALVLGIHRLMAEALTFVNVVGNCIATIVVAKWDDALQSETLYAQIGTNGLRALPAAKPAE